MNTLGACPDIQVLKLLDLGHLDDQQISQLQAHLSQCQACVETMNTLASNDHITEAIQGQWGLLDLEEEPVEQLIERLHTQGSPAALCQTSNGDLALTSTSPSVDPDHADSVQPLQFPFLAYETGKGQLGPYQVLSVLGSGGMGIVFEAEDLQLKRKVALKVMKPELASNADARRRFLREARTTAAIQHDHIVTIHQVGQDRGIPFLAMQLLLGETLEKSLGRERRLPLADAVRIGWQIAEGLAVAHAHGLVHRDIKPANIWLESESGPASIEAAGSNGSPPAPISPLSSRRVKILDFGLARDAAESNHTTQSGIVAGTPAYMAPEQATDEPIDHRCDLFSLGCILYRMVTGEMPFQGIKTLTILWALAVKQPEPPERFNPMISPDLSGLIMRLLAKNPEDRPQNAQAVVRELQACESEAGPSRLSGRSSSRQPFRAVAIAATVMLLTLIGVSGFLFGPAIYRVVTNQGLLIIESDDPDVQLVISENDQIVRIIDNKVGKSITLHAGTYHIELGEGNDRLTLSTNRFTLKRDGKEIVRVSLEPAITEVQQFLGLTELPYSAAFCMNDKSIVSCGGGDLIDGQWLPGTDFALRIWDVASGKELRRLEGHRGVVQCLAVSPEGRRALSGGGGNEQDFAIRLWDLTTGELLKTLPGHTGRVMSLVFSPDGHQAYSAGGESTSESYLPIRVWDLDSGKEIRQLLGHTIEIKSLSLSADGRTLLSGCQDGTARIWDTTSGKEMRRFPLVDQSYHCVALSADGKQALTAGPELVIRLWDVANAKIVRTFRGQSKEWVGGVAFTPDGKQLIAGGGDDNTIRLWNLKTGNEISRIERGMQMPSVNNRPFSSDGQFFLAFGRDKVIRLLKLPP